MVWATVGELLSTRSRSSFRLWFSSVSSCTLRDRLSSAPLSFRCRRRPAFRSPAGLGTRPAQAPRTAVPQDMNSDPVSKLSARTGLRPCVRH